MCGIQFYDFNRPLWLYAGATLFLQTGRGRVKVDGLRSWCQCMLNYFQYIPGKNYPLKGQFRLFAQLIQTDYPRGTSFETSDYFVQCGVPDSNAGQVRQRAAGNRVSRQVPVPRADLAIVR